MLAVVQFPKDDEMDEMSEALEQEIDLLFDYMDERMAEDARAYDLLMAMIIVVKMISDSEKLTQAVH
jgi:hypothetical protein